METINAISPIIKALVADFPDAEIEELAACCSYRTIPKGGYFIRAGQIPKKLCFLSKGLVRYYYPDNDGNEFIKGFLADGAILNSYTAMKSNTPSYFSIQAITPLEIYEFSFSDWMKIIASNSIWNAFLVAVLEMGYMKKEKREREFLLFDAEARYKIFREEIGVLESQIKQHQIASYLGITPVALSRIRRKMKT